MDRYEYSQLQYAQDEWDSTHEYVHIKIPRRKLKFLPKYPLKLEGILDADEYHKTIVALNLIIASICKKWYYSEGMQLTCGASGFALGLPILLGCVLLEKRVQKICLGLRAYLDDINPACMPKGIRWVLDNGKYAWDLYIQLPGDQQYLNGGAAR